MNAVLSPAKFLLNIADFSIGSRKLHNQLCALQSDVSDVPAIVFIIPFTTVGGADKLIIDLASGLRTEYKIFFITTIPGDNLWHDRFAEIGRVWHLPLLSKRYANYPRLIAEIVKALRPGVIIISNSDAGYQSLPLCEMIAPATVIDILHGQGGVIDNGSAPRYMQPYEQYVDLHITVTEYLKTFMIQNYGTSPHKIKTIHSGVDTDAFKKNSERSGLWRDKLAISRKKIVISWLGRLAEEKRPELFIEAVALALQKQPVRDNCHFILAGDGSLGGKLKRLAARLGLDDHLSFTGYVDAADLLLDTDILALTSEMEGLPLVILEAMAMSVAVFASKVGGVPEAVENFKTGLLFEFDETFTANLAEAIVRAVADTSLIKQLGLSGRARVEQEFAVNHMVERYRQVIGEVACRTAVKDSIAVSLLPT